MLFCEVIFFESRWQIKVLISWHFCSNRFISGMLLLHTLHLDWFAYAAFRLFFGSHLLGASLLRFLSDHGADNMACKFLFRVSITAHSRIFVSFTSFFSGHFRAFFKRSFVCVDYIFPSSQLILNVE